MAHIEKLIEARPAPMDGKGIAGKISMLRQRGLFHAVLSLVSYAVLAAMVWVLLRWAISPTWSASSVAECREILGGDHGKALSLIHI